ncbi:MAG: DUF2384 domain-containing protein [Lachnospiraceae bacterium]|nr:DUF2384 domain-containing protein [Lachnospiraceae bacterium]
MDMLEFFAREYKEDEWNKYVKCFDKLNIYIEKVPQDIVDVVLTILGNDEGYNWLHAPLHKFDGRNALDLLKTQKGERALKAYIMRLPN